MPRYSVNDRFFSVIDTEAKAYWLGFLYADGYVSRCGVGVSLSLKDRAHLERFKEAICYTGPIYERGPRSNVMKDGRTIGGLGSCEVRISRDQMRQDLAKNGCGPRKSLTLTFPTGEQVSPSLLPHFLRGYLDGDGWISSSRPKSGGGKRLQFMSGFIGTVDFLTQLRTYLVSQGFGFPTIRTKTNEKIGTIVYGGNQTVKRLHDLLYSNATIFLERKRKHFDECAAMEKTTGGVPKGYLFLDPDGKETEIFNLSRFCREHQMQMSCMMQVMAGKRRHHHGYHFVRRLD